MQIQPRLRPIADDDVLTVLDLNARDVDLLAPMDAARLEQLRGWAAHADVIDLGEQVAGFVITVPMGTGYDSVNYRWFVDTYGASGEGITYLDRVVIGEAFRRRGLARWLYDELERDTARSTPRMGLEVNLDPPNEPSLAFHRDRGYVEVGQGGEPGHVVSRMVKTL